MSDDAVIRKYLLGETTDEEAAEVERTYFVTEAALDAAGAAEWDLLEDYLSGKLPEPSRSRFESHYLRTPGHRTRLAMARALRTEGARAKPRSSHKVLYFMPLAAAAILVLAVLAVVWGLRLPGEVRRLPETSLLHVDLPLVAVRSEGEAPTATLQPGIAVLELSLEAGTAAPPYTMRLRTVEGREVWRGEAAGQPTFRIPAGDLAPGDYVAELTGRADGGSDAAQRYYVRILRP